jgi:hypothetical protein
MAHIDARLTREVQEAGAAGSILFAWMDEWFKKNWAVIDYEIPLDNTRLWHNVMDAEQSYGILGHYSGVERTTPRLGGMGEAWLSLPRVEGGTSKSGPGPRQFRMAADESFLYLVVEFSPGRFAWDTLGVQIALDTYLPRMGQHRLPVTQIQSEIGFEFLIELTGPANGFIRVIPEYNRYDSRIDPHSGDDFGRFSRLPVITRDRQDGRIDSLFIITNRARFGRDGTFYPARGYDRGRLRYGTEAASTLADWYFDETTGLLELRMPWDLINVTDPSTRALLYETRSEAKEFRAVPAGDFHVGVLLYRTGNRGVVGALPALNGGVWRATAFNPWRWQGWGEPRYQSRLKPVYDSLRMLWQAAPAAGLARPARRAP